MKNNTENTHSQYNYEPLRAAILKQAIKDYKTAIRKRNRNQISLLEHFFRSEWGQLLSDNNGEYIIERVKNSMKKK